MTIVARRRSTILIISFGDQKLQASISSLQTKCQKLFKVWMRNCLVSAIVLENCMFILNKICFCSLPSQELIFCRKVIVTAERLFHHLLQTLRLSPVIFSFVLCFLVNT